ncbi:hypothetical protein AAG906_013139 [Vitis piasezkii]
MLNMSSCLHHNCSAHQPHRRLWKVRLPLLHHPQHLGLANTPNFSTPIKTNNPSNCDPSHFSTSLREAMSNEFTALMKHGTWDLVLPPSNYKPMGCKWVF